MMTKIIQRVNGSFVKFIKQDMSQFTKNTPHPQTQAITKKMIIATKSPENVLFMPKALYSLLVLEVAAKTIIVIIKAYFQSCLQGT